MFCSLILVLKTLYLYNDIIHLSYQTPPFSVFLYQYLIILLKKNVGNFKNSDLDNITSANTLLYTFKYLPPSFLDNPNSHFKVSGWTAVPYLSLSNTATGAGWGVILGIYDNNNGTPMGRQFVIGTSKCMERRYLNGTWQSWVDK